MINFRGNMESLAYKERIQDDHYFAREGGSMTHLLCGEYS
jgi:hypothetical protein